MCVCKKLFRCVDVFIVLLYTYSPKASDVNYVPTVNQDLSEGKLVLDHAPQDPIGQDFSTKTMIIIDQILSTLGNSKDGLGKWPTLLVSYMGAGTLVLILQNNAY